MSLRTLLACVAVAASVAASPVHNAKRGLFGRALNGTEPSLPYRNASLSIDERLDDLSKHMTLEEKAGQLFQPRLYIGDGYTLDEGAAEGESARNSTEFMLGTQFLTHFSLTSPVDDIEKTAEWYNALQQRAAETRLGILVSLSSDPRHAYSDNSLVGFMASRFSQWPEALGLAALRDPALVKKFAQIARAEYVAVGLRTALHPQLDLSTMARWPRIGTTFGEDADLTTELALAYIEGFSGDEYDPGSVTTIVKHFPGGGPTQNGEDSHFEYGQNQSYPGGNCDYFLEPFEAAIAAGAGAIMPGHARPVGTKYDEVGFAFNRGMITDLLWNQLGFDGIIVTDWQLVTDAIMMDRPAAVLASWGASADTLLDLVFGVVTPEGKLPFDLPRSNAAVDESFVDLPFDTEDPVFRFGHDLRYSKCRQKA